MKSVFDKIDSFDSTFLGFNFVGALQNVRTWRKYIAFLTVGALFGWIVLGWESTWNQAGTLLQSIPSLIIGQTSLSQVQAEVASGYGVGQHLSTAVIYGLCFVLLSIHLEKHEISKSKNFFFTTALTIMSVGIYEIVYNILYSNLQNQAWTFTLASKQGLNLIAFGAFTAIGALALVYLYAYNFRLNFSKVTFIFISLSVLTYCLWVFFPFSLTPLTVQTTAGTWTSTNLFPQTMYAVNLDPAAGANHAIGTPYFVQNDVLHLINILNKLFMSLTVLSLVMIRRKK